MSSHLHMPTNGARHKLLHTILVTTLLGLFGSQVAADPRSDWQMPFDISLPERARTILLKPGADPQSLAERLGLEQYDVLSRGRQGSILETRLNEEQWQQVQESACAGAGFGAQVEACETAGCQSIQLQGDATPGSDQGAQAVQARLVRNPPELVPVPDDADLEAGSCSGPPLIPPLAGPAAAGAGNVPLDMRILRALPDGSSSRAKTPAGSPDAGVQGAPSAQDAQDAASTTSAPGSLAGGVDDTTGGVIDGQTDGQMQGPVSGADAAQSARSAARGAPRSFEFVLNSGFNPRGGVQLGTDDLPEDTSDWSLVVGAGCSEVSVPLDSLAPARQPGMVLAVVVSGNAADVASSYNLQVVREITLDTTGETLAVFATADNLSQVLGLMALDARVADAQPEFIYGTTATVGAEMPGAVAPAAGHSDPFDWLTYGPKKTGATALHGEQVSGEGQLIAVIDTGVDVEHPDLKGRIREHLDVSARGWSADAHGTAVAGIIAANADNGLGSYGVAPESEILALKACQPKEGGMQARCWTSTLVKALDVAMARDAGVINMSLAGPPDDLLARYVGLAAQQNRVVVAAAGNGGPNAKPGFPAALPGVLAVTAVDATDGLYEMANVGDYVDVAAPGVDIVTPAPDGGYPPLSGTSMAAAHASGIAALLRELMPMSNAAELVAVLKANVTDLGAAGRDTSFGAGLIDACRAAELVSAAAVVCPNAPAALVPREDAAAAPEDTPRLDRGAGDELVIELD